MGLLDNFGQLINQGYASKVAERLGENPQNVSRGLQAGSSSILAGIANRTSDSGFMGQVFNLISSKEPAIQEIDPAAYTQEAESGTGIGAASSHFLSDLFGQRASAVHDVVARSSGLSLNSVSSIMRFAAPMVLGFLGRQVRTLGLDQSSFTRVLSEERGNIMRSAPAGLASAIGVEPREREVPIEGARTAPEYVTQRERLPEKHGGSRWLWPTIAALVVIALFWGARSRSHRVPGVDTSTAAGTVAPSPAYPETAMAPSTATPGLPATAAPGAAAGTISLPNGTTINAPAGSTETRVFSFINGRTPVSGMTVFNVDRVGFANNASTLSPTSDDQLTNLAAILKAYPTASIKVIGFADTTGNTAASQHLAAMRATALRAALVKKGIAARRVMAQGYAGEHPLADSLAAQGGMPSSRVALVVLHR